MFCPSCGKQIPEDSRFCLYCGTSTSSPPRTTVSFSEDPPQYITSVGWVTDVPTEKKLGKILHGFRYWFVLLDGNNKPTIANGNILVRLSKWINTIYFGDAWSTVWEKSIQLGKSDFTKIEGLRAFPNGVVGFIQNVRQAVLNDKDVLSARLEIWFTTPEGRKLYGK